MKEYTFNIHGVTVKLTSDDSSVAKDIKEEIREFETSPLCKAEICVQFLSDAYSVQHREIMVISEKITDTVYSFEDLTKICGIVTVREKFSHDEAVLITLSLIGYLVRYKLALERDITAMHAASFALQSKGVLILGHSGAGKTTTSCIFIKNGFYYLSDEDSLIEKEKGKFSILSFPRNLRLGGDFTNSIEGRNILKPYPLKKYEAFYEQGYMLNPRDIRKDCIAKRENLSLFIILENSEKIKQLCVKPLKDISALYRIISLSEILSSEENKKEISFQIQKNNRNVFEIANFLFDTVPLYEIKYNLKRHLKELPEKVKELLGVNYGKENIRKNTFYRG